MDKRMSMDDFDMEKRLKSAAEGMPVNETELKISPVMAERRRERRLFGRFKNNAGFRSAVIALLIAVGGTSTVMAASPQIRSAIAKFFTSGITEVVPTEELNIGQKADADAQTDGDTNVLSGEETVFFADGIKLIHDVTLDEHFSVDYIGSDSFEEIITLSSGKELLCKYINGEFESSRKYFDLSLEDTPDKPLQEVEVQTLEFRGSVSLQNLKGIYSADGDYDNFAPDEIEVAFEYEKYEDDLLVNSFDASLDTDDAEHDYDMYINTIDGQADVVEAVLMIDAQMTNYQYPFIINLNTGEVSDLLSKVDLSGYACVTELYISDDLKTATARAGDSFEKLVNISIDIETGEIKEEPDAYEAIPEECEYGFYVDEDTLFYVVEAEGTEYGESETGYLYNVNSGEKTTVFDGASNKLYSEGECFWESLGGGYIALYEDNALQIIRLSDGGERVYLTEITYDDPQSVQMLLNTDGSLLSIEVYENGSTGAKRMYMLDTESFEVWYFDRDVEEGIEEVASFWRGKNCFVTEAEDSESGMYYNYIYLYNP